MNLKTLVALKAPLGSTEPFRGSCTRDIPYSLKRLAKLALNALLTEAPSIAHPLPVPNERVDKYPNELRKLREERLLTRSQLEELTRRLEETDPSLYRRIGFEAVKSLESGWTRPRPTTARTIAEVLGVSVNEIFVSGIDHGLRHGPKKG
jgi:hypothetical protein